MVCFKYVTVNTLNKVDNKDDDDKLKVIMAIITSSSQHQPSKMGYQMWTVKEKINSAV
jgi:hypothetical protein